ARQYTIYPGLVIDVEDRLEKGEAIHPLDHVPRSTERRDARIRAEEEQRLEVERRLRRVEDEYGGEPGQRWEVRPDDSDGTGEALDARAEPGRLRLRVEPSDASIYLDGRFLGTGSELSRLRTELIVDPGEHRLEVVRPGRQAEARRIEIESGRELAVEIEL